jgi:hypothetical protein
VRQIRCHPLQYQAAARAVLDLLAAQRLTQLVDRDRKQPAPCRTSRRIECVERGCVGRRPRGRRLRRRLPLGHRRLDLIAPVTTRLRPAREPAAYGLHTAAFASPARPAPRDQQQQAQSREEDTHHDANDRTPRKLRRRTCCGAPHRPDTLAARLGESIAAAVLWLCSPGASFVVGVALPVDGGFTAH